MGTDSIIGKATGSKPLSWQATSRVGAAALGGYAFTAAVTAWLTLLLPLPKTEAILTAAMLSFLWYSGAIIWAFAAPTPWRAWLGLLIPAALCTAMTVPFAITLGQ